jgi:hypothetical protein
MVAQHERAVREETNACDRTETACRNWWVLRMRHEVTATCSLPYVERQEILCSVIQFKTNLLPMAKGDNVIKVNYFMSSIMQKIYAVCTRLPVQEE